MKLLLFILGLVFFYIFFTFSQRYEIESNFFNIFYQANFYVVFSVCTIFYLIKQEKNKSKKEEYIEEKDKIVTKQKIIQLISLFFSKCIFPLACILFYISLFLLSKSLFEISSLPYVFLSVNILLIFLYSFLKSSPLIQRFIAINTSLLSLYYIFSHVLYIVWFWWGFIPIDFLNIFITWVFFYICICSRSFSSYKELFYSFILVFLYLEIIILLQYITSETLFSVCMALSLWWATLLYYTSKLSSFLSVSKSFIRLLWVYSLFLMVLFSIFLWIISWPYMWILIPILLFMWYILYMFHFRFENYPSLFFWLFALSTWILHSIFSLLWFASYSFYAFFMLSFGVLIVDIFLENIYTYDSYVFHCFSLLVNLCSCICFFIYIDISILSLSLLLLGESIYLFVSYYSLPAKNDSLYTWI